MFIVIKLILPGPGFEPVTSRVAGRRCPCILSHLTQTDMITRVPTIVIERYRSLLFGMFWAKVGIILKVCKISYYCLSFKLFAQLYVTAFPET
jgi:hypothetical protein